MGFGDGPLGKERLRLEDRKSDREQKRLQTNSKDKAKAARDEAKVLAGPWLHEIPPSKYPLDAAGKAAYDYVTRLLFDANKLTWVSKEIAETYALFEMRKNKAIEAGKMPTGLDLRESKKILQYLGIADNAPKLSEHADKESKFKRVGFAATISAPR